MHLARWIMDNSAHGDFQLDWKSVNTNQWLRWDTGPRPAPSKCISGACVCSLFASSFQSPALILPNHEFLNIHICPIYRTFHVPSYILPLPPTQMVFLHALVSVICHEEAKLTHYVTLKCNYWVASLWCLPFWKHYMVRLLALWQTYGSSISGRWHFIVSLRPNPSDDCLLQLHRRLFKGLLWNST